jgi:integrase/recombinase XerD
MAASFDSTDLATELETYYTAIDARGGSPRTLQQYRFELGNLQAWLGNQGVTDLTQIARAHLDKYLVYLRDRKQLKPNSCHAAYRSFRAFFNWYETSGDAPPDWRNPTDRMRGPKVPKNRLPSPPLENIKAILQTCRGHSFNDDRDRALILFLLDTGVRANECSLIDVGDLEPKRGRVFVQHGKGGASRYAYPSPDTMKAVQAYLRHRGDPPADAPLWASADGERLSYWGLRQIVERRADRAGVDTPPLHGFRRAFATAANKQGVTSVDLQRLLGHADAQTLWRYVAVEEAHIEQVARRTSPALLVL